ncbi:hypothetical protein EHI8A_000490 [Entamoeba histolytica HM-1:IMSS-B]|uniref:Uncharacterized protein n=5 Tax=Entamoeba histolytica TaxID=5759 RepID=A0A175JKI4_ENTHI|nr:Hypothetical protein EHI5A_002020 [Entamoeba histolytica KU27]EMH72462.1 hypothetical protein EHI8A_000490 [Entamoeba histolytica HM-1:IMSS-B]EMS15020.1 hypothetical protein KM1_001080 [Entamoeba histolytica HM-3:IMSS]ENY60692.1 unknown protein, putative [Entamoeba histolytica HM-1:IMSS-A]GAT93933.1 hypothetical protein CL6EHI_c00167 [Entamoeba histolytica]
MQNQVTYQASIKKYGKSKSIVVVEHKRVNEILTKDWAEEDNKNQECDLEIQAILGGNEEGNLDNVFTTVGTNSVVNEYSSSIHPTSA